MRLLKTLGRAVFLTTVALAAGAALPAHAQTGYPMIIAVSPTGLQRGTTAEVAITGRFNLQGAYAVQFECKGITAEVVAPAAADAAKPTDSIKLKVTTTAEAPLGPQEFRIATPRGFSSIGQLVIYNLPQVLEKEPNNTVAAATPVEFPAVLDGVVGTAEDVDCYKFTAKAGDQIAFDCMSARLEDKIHDLTPGGGGAHSDPILVITDESGRELASGDDFYGPDPVMGYRFEKAGTYVLQIRDVRYMGSPGWTYCVTCTRDPLLLGVYPMAGERGKSVAVQPVGFNLAGMPQGSVQVPMMDPGPMDVQIATGKGGAAQMSNPVKFIVSDLPQFQEVVGNNTAEKATPVQLPAGLNGRIEAENGEDCFRFKGVKGQPYSFEVNARRYGSSLDSWLDLLDAKGNLLVNNDDTAGIGKDSHIDWTCPADAEYVLRIRDTHTRGGSEYFYNIEARLAKPDFVVVCDDDKALVDPGGGYAMYLIATRKHGFTGEIKLAVEGLPPGVTCTADRIPANMTQACMIFRGAPDAKVSFSRIHVFATGTVTGADGKPETLRREVRPEEEIYFPGGGRGRFGVDLHSVSVTDPTDIQVKLSTNKVELKPGGTATVDVEVVRSPTYKLGVSLDVYLRHLGGKFGDPLPPGVSMDEGASKTLLGPTDTKGKIVLKAAADAPEITDLPIAVLGQVSINFVVKVSHASEPLLISVKK